MLNKDLFTKTHPHIQRVNFFNYKMHYLNYILLDLMIFP